MSRIFQTGLLESGHIDLKKPLGAHDTTSLKEGGLDFGILGDENADKTTKRREADWIQLGLEDDDAWHQGYIVPSYFDVHPHRERKPGSREEMRFKLSLLLRENSRMPGAAVRKLLLEYADEVSAKQDNERQREGMGRRRENFLKKGRGQSAQSTLTTD